MKLLILGAGNCQLNSILKAKQKGHIVISSDYYTNAPGKDFCDFKELASTFDCFSNIEIAKRYSVDGVMTIGTDQPVLTVAKVCEALNLPSFIDTKTAKNVTNKKFMKRLFKETEIPTPNYKILNKAFKDEEIENIKFPVVIKPLDSQGQRGVLKLYSITQIRARFDEVLSFSREGYILLEEYYKSDEITVSGWVADSEVTILTVTDRVTFENESHIGICTAHNFPSKNLKKYYEEIRSVTIKIVEVFEIKNGPIYFQMLIGDEGIKVNEVACRVGGAYEDELIPLLTGIDILDMLIDYTLGNPVDYRKLRQYNLLDNEKVASVQMIFAKPGKIEKLGDMNNIKKLNGVFQAKFIVKPGDEIKEIENATQRAGYMIIEGYDKVILKENIENALETLKIYNRDGINMLYKI